MMSNMWTKVFEQIKKVTGSVDIASDGTLQEQINNAKNKIVTNTATQSANGLMSAADKKKLDGVANGAQVNSVTGVKGSSESSYRSGDVNITAANVGLGNVGNFKAVSTVASQGLTDTEKSNARTNMGAGTSSFSGSYNDLTNKPTIPTVNNGTLTIQKNGTNVQTFTANQGTNATANITVPTKTSELTNDNDFITSSNADNKYADKNIYSDTAINIGRYEGSDIGYLSTAEGYRCTASSNHSHAEGTGSTASGDGSHAEGESSTASGDYSHAEGESNTASGETSHAEGAASTASGDGSHAEGYRCTASGDYSHAEGCYTTALDYQHAQGHHNNTSLATDGTYSGTGTGTAVVIGNGTSSSKSNAIRIDYNGKMWCKAAYSSTGADYAELFEWQDGNPDSEDRRGRFVTLNGDKIVYAKQGDWILGIVSANPCIIGNTDTEWQGQYLKDEFGAYIKETTTETVKIQKTDENGKKIEVEEEREVEFYKENPEYDPDKPYTDRSSRPEWDAVGMFGVLAVYDDGTCEVGGFCECNDEAVATKSDNGYRVIQRVSDNIVKIVVK